jgi:hypothetical protein
MNSNLDTTPGMQERFAEVFSHLPEQDIEQFYAHYQLWVLRHRVPILEKQIEALQEHREENQQLLQKLQPPSIALAVLARLQSKGVNDVALLDQMLERGEDWLDRMMQRLDYCEQVEDFIQGDYNQWCLNSLEGAYDWIDTLRGNQREETSRTLDAEEVANGELTEELLLQKLSFDEDAIPAPTPEQSAILIEPPFIEETALLDQQQAVEELPAGSIESTMLALFLNQGTEEETEAEETERTPEAVSTVPWYSVNLAEDEPLELNQVDWIKVLQEDTVARVELSETEETGTAEEIESKASEATVLPEQEVLTSNAEEIERTVSEPEQIEQASLTIEESDALLNANEPVETIVAEEQAETLTEEVISIVEQSEQTTPEETEPDSTEVTSDIDETHLDEQAQSEIAASAEQTNTTIVDESDSAEQTNTTIVDESDSAESLEIVSNEPTETSVDTNFADETTIQEQTNKPSEATGMYYYNPATEDEQPAWYDYLESNPEISHILKQEWQIKPEALPTALMWENKTDSVADEQTQPIILQEIKLASETQSMMTEDQETAEPQEPLSVHKAESDASAEEQTVLNASQDASAVLLSEEQQTLTSESKVDDVEQTLAALHPVDELPAVYIQETVIVEEETIQIQESASNGQSREIVERIEEVHVVPIQPQQPATPDSTSQEAPKKPGFWRRLFGKK